MNTKNDKDKKQIDNEIVCDFCGISPEDKMSKKKRRWVILRDEFGHRFCPNCGKPIMESAGRTSLPRTQL